MSRSISGGIVRDICIAELASSIKTSPVPLVLRNALNLQPPWITVITDENDDMDTISISSSSSSSSSSPTAFLRSRCADARVSVSVSADSAFRGSVYDNERIDVRFDEFLDRFDAAFFDKENTENSNKRTASSYYLAQCSIQSQSTSAPLSMLADDVSRAASSLIDAFGSATLLESNLWMSLDAATTSPHFR
jgi:hypothetical protein